MASSEERADQSLSPDREKQNRPLVGGDTHASLCPRKMEITVGLTELLVKFSDLWNTLLCFRLAFGVGMGWQGEIICAVPFCWQRTTLPNIQLVSDKRPNRLAVSISCKWLVPCFVNPLHASRLMPLSRVVCGVGRLPPTCTQHFS